MPALVSLAVFRVMDFRFLSLPKAALPMVFNLADLAAKLVRAGQLEKAPLFILTKAAEVRFTLRMDLQAEKALLPISLTAGRVIVPLGLPMVLSFGQL